MLSNPRLKEKVKPISQLFRAASGINRAQILYLLIREPLTLPVIIRRTRMSPSLAAHHLKVLRKAGWVTKSKFGRLVTYMLEEGTRKDVIRFLQTP